MSDSPKVEDAKVRDISKGEYTDEDGVVFQWDPNQKAWFPKIDEDFLARYQMMYGKETEIDKTGESVEKDQQEFKDKANNMFELFAKGNENIDHEVKIAQLENQITKKAMEKIEQQFKHDVLGIEEENGEEENEVDTSEEKQKNEENTKNEEVEKTKKTGWNSEMELHNCCVYVSNLPLSMTMQKFEEMMSKYGMIKRDPVNNELKLKLYKMKDSEEIKGDGICFYLKPQSVDLAIQLLHKSQYEGKTILCERAKFEMKGEFDAKKAKKKALTQKKRAFENKKKLFQWRLDEEKTHDNRRKNHEQVVVFRGCFNSQDMSTDILLKSRVKLAMQKLCQNYGDVAKVTVYGENEAGIVTVKFKTIPEADLCVEKTNNTLFGTKIIGASLWDGKEKFHVRETEEEEQNRIEEWHSALEADS